MTNIKKKNAKLKSDNLQNVWTQINWFFKNKTSSTSCSSESVAVITSVDVARWSAREHHNTPYTRINTWTVYVDDVVVMEGV
jgi:hypothetical protein